MSNMKFEYQLLLPRRRYMSKMFLLIFRERNYLNKLCGTKKQTEAV
jgi:hypothetical protein